MLNLELESPGITARRLKEACPFLTWSHVSNMMLASLFNSETAKHFSAATGFLLHVNIGYIRPLSWNASLARSYLQTNRLDDLITVMFVTSRKSLLGQTEPDKNMANLFRTLEYILSLLPRFQPGRPSSHCCAGGAGQVTHWGAQHGGGQLEKASEK